MFVADVPSAQVAGVGEPLVAAGAAVLLLHLDTPAAGHRPAAGAAAEPVAHVDLTGKGDGLSHCEEKQVRLLVLTRVFRCVYGF